MASEMYVDINSSAPSLADLVEEVERTRQPRTIRRADAVVAVITPVRIRPGDPAAKERLFQTLDQIDAQSSARDSDEIEADIAAVVKEVRQEQHGTATHRS